MQTPIAKLVPPRAYVMPALACEVEYIITLELYHNSECTKYS